MSAANNGVNRSGGEDAICFTSGPSGAFFSAGVLHAWLAIDRKPPLVAAGISTGAISAAAMRRSYQELESAPAGMEEERRWEWFRRYLTAIVNNPVGIVWNAVPDPGDFFATMPPVRDPSVPESLLRDAEDARRHYFLLTKLGNWLAGLPVRVSTIATLLVMYVRRKEGYGFWISTQWLFHWSFFKVAVGVWWHILFSPTRIWEPYFWGDGQRCRNKSHMFLHPLLGFVWFLCLFAPPIFIFGGALLFYWILSLVHEPVTMLSSVAISVVFWMVLIKLLFNLPINTSQRGSGALRWFIPRLLFSRLDLAKALLNPYELKRQLYELFVANAPDHVRIDPSSKDVHLLVVCAALEETDQVCLQDTVSLVDALTAATAIPGLFPPVKMRPSHLRSTVKANPDAHGNFNIIDGAAVRTNPIPAFFEWCKESVNRPLVERLESRPEGPCSLHVVYSVPIAYPGSVQDAPTPSDPDIVESAFLAHQLEKRRDTRQEVRQTNFTSKLESIRRKVTDQSGGRDRGPFVIVADEIAPRQEIDIGSGLAPDRKKMMATVAAGCRATLESLYRDDLLAFGRRKPVQCPQFLAHNAARRCNPTRTGLVYGLPEVCQACSGTLEYHEEQKPDEPPIGVLRTFGDKGTKHKSDLSAEFRHLVADTPKIVFLGSGGVFRGAFHIGVIGAMAAAELYPDLVVGASIGALMGGALCNISAGSRLNEAKVINDLASLFLKVDQKVALTRTLKNAAKQLGNRARRIELSPAKLARMVRRGSQADSGYAATGAPPALIDALSYLFRIPHRKTTAIASQFVAGHISQATNHFFGQLREETLSSFDVKSAMMGTSLLEGEVHKLLGGLNGFDLHAFQPYHRTNRKRVSFFCVTSFLNARISLVLGRDFLSTDPTWNGVFAGLSSSAFPAVFAPRTEAELLPGRGRTDRFFADGGIFDNLPFFPAIEILAAAQRSDEKTDPLEIQNALNNRADQPNIFIAAGLNAPPEPGGEYSTLFEIKDRADRLSVESKTDTFRRGADRTIPDLGVIALQGGFTELPSKDLKFLDSSVSAAVVSISPADPKHINPTFAFCRSTGLNMKRVQTSIADGCFQSLAQFEANIYVNAVLTKAGGPITKVTGTPKPGACRFYLKGGKALNCPFQQCADPEVRAIWKVCTNDVHHGAGN